MSEALARHFTDAAAFLRGFGSAPALAALDGVIGTVPSDSVLGFSLGTLRRDQSGSEVMRGNIEQVRQHRRLHTGELVEISRNRTGRSPWASPIGGFVTPH